MTKTRVIAALVMAPIAIAAILLLPTPWLVALVALVFLVGLWEWFKLAEIDDTLSRTVLLVANLLLMVLLVWASAGSMVLFQIVTLPVEFDASHRAMGFLTEYGILSENEAEGSRRVLRAAAMTYVAAAAAALLNLLRLVMLSRRDDRRD